MSKTTCTTVVVYVSGVLGQNFKGEGLKFGMPVSSLLLQLCMYECEFGHMTTDCWDGTRCAVA